MASLIATLPGEGLDLPFEAGAARLCAVDPGPVWSVAPFRGRDGAAGSALRAAFGLGFPKPGRALARGGVSCLWTGRGAAFLAGAAPPEGLSEIAALTEQGDGWAVFRLAGTATEAVLARLVPLDLSEAAFGRGAVARTALGHMPLILHRVAGDGFDLWVFRSMAGSAVHEIAAAMRGVAARAAIG